jgi:protein required for attachment to host cells
MNIPKDAVVAVADGEILHLYHNAGDEAAPKLVAMEHGAVDTANTGSGGRHHSSSANPSDSQLTGTAAMLNSQVLDGKIEALVIVAAPRTLGELRKHYHKALSAVLVGEIAKDLTGHSIADIEKSIAAN